MIANIPIVSNYIAMNICWLNDDNIYFCVNVNDLSYKNDMFLISFMKYS